MLETQILEIFYQKIVVEAQAGKIDCYFTMNMLFNLVIENKLVSKCQENSWEGVLIPTLKISNKKLFDDLLIKYVKKAINFYSKSEFAFLEDLNFVVLEDIATIKNEYLIKYIICTLFANASFKDFENPLEFLNSRISMFDNKILNTDPDEEICLGYLDSIKAKIYLKEEVSPIKSETPYRIISYLLFDDGYILNLPEIYAGNNGKRYLLYGIQKTNFDTKINERYYLKAIRKGFIAKINGAPEHYFLATMLFMSLCNDQEIEIINFLIERWNAKRIAIYNKAIQKNNILVDDIQNKQNKIQNNITNIFIRYFTKIEDVTKGIEFSAIPIEMDNNFHLRITEDFESRCAVFNELYNLANEYKQSIKHR